MSEFDPETLAKLPEEYRESVTEEIARLSKGNDDLRIENKEVEKETIRQMLGMQNSALENMYRYDFGPFYFVCSMNELALGSWCCVEDGYLTILLNFLCFTMGVDIPLQIGAENEEDE